MVTSAKRAYATPMSGAPRASVPAADHGQPVPPQETKFHVRITLNIWDDFLGLEV